MRLYDLGPRIYQALNIGTQESLLIIGISGSLALIYTTVALALIDRVGRIKPLIVGALGCGFAMLVNAVLSDYFPADSGNHNALRAQVAMNFIIQFFFVPLGVISWVYPAEIFPTEVRAKGNALATLVNWSTNLLFAQVSPIALGQIGFRYFYVFFAFNMVSATCFFFFYPETKGYTLEEVNQLFGDQAIPHALEDPSGAAVVIEAKDATIEHMASVNRV
jgi:MFS family permease